MRSIILSIFLILFFTGQAISKPVPYTVNTHPYEGYYVSAGENSPLVILIHDWDGLTDYEIKRAHMLQALGYSVFAMDLFGKGVKPVTVEEKRALTGALYKDREKMRAVMNAALAAAKDQGGDVTKTAVAGYCFGGAAVLEWARSGVDLKGFIPFHGGLSTPEGQDYSKAAGRFLVLHGTADKVVSMADFASLATELEAAGLDHEMISYGGARHAFTVFGSDRYHEQADKKSWDRFTQFLEELFKDHN